MCGGNRLGLKGGEAGGDVLLCAEQDGGARQRGEAGTITCSGCASAS